MQRQITVLPYERTSAAAPSRAPSKAECSHGSASSGRNHRAGAPRHYHFARAARGRDTASVGIHLGTGPGSGAGGSSEASGSVTRAEYNRERRRTAENDSGRWDEIPPAFCIERGCADPAVLCLTLSHSCLTLSFSAPPQTHRGAGRCQLPCVLRRAEELLLLRGLLGGLLCSLLLCSLFLGSHCTTPFKEGLSLAIPR